MNAQRWEEPPRLLVVVSLLALLVCGTLAALGAFQAGVTTDEPIHVMRLRNFFDTGWYALDWDFAGTTPGADDTNTFVYAPVAMLFLHGWSVVWGTESWGAVSTTAAAYDIRHLGVVVLGALGVLAVVAVARVLSGWWLWGAVAGACLVAVPMWTGHTMFNVKDVPVATGNSLVTLGLICFVTSGWPRRRVRLARVVVTTAGLVLALGTRPGLWPGILVAVVITVVAVAGAQHGRRRGALLELGAALVAATAVLLAVYPNLFGSPLRALVRTATGSATFPGGEPGTRLYVPLHVAEEVPTLLLCFVLVGAAAALAFTWKRGRSDTVTAARLLVVGVQAFAIPLAAVLLGSDLYHGLRQLLFLVPAAAVLAAYGMAWCLQRLHDARPLVAVVAAAALALPVVDQVTLQPYQTTYVNLATDLVSAAVGEDHSTRPGGDFWRVSIPELLQGTSLDRPLLCKATVVEETNESYPFVNGSTVFSTSRSLDCRAEPNGPLSADPQPITRTSTLGHEYDAIFLKAPPDNCTRLHDVSRARHGFDVVLTVLARCSVDPPRLGRRSVTASDPALGTAVPRDLWRFAIGGWEQWPREQVLRAPLGSAELALRPSKRCAGAGCVLVLDGTWPEDLVVQVDGERARAVRRGDGTVQVALGPQHDRDPRVLVSLSRRSGEALTAELAAIWLERGEGR